MLKGVLLFILIVSVSGVYAEAALSCKNLLLPKIVSPKTAPLRFMSYNVLNLYLHKGKYIWGEDGLEKINQDHLPKQKPEDKTQGVAKAILATKPDFVLLQEVEGVESLERFNKEYLGAEYKTFMPPTNDERGIGVAFLIRKNMDVVVEIKNSIDLTWKNPTGRKEKVFSRNFPIFKIYRPNEKEPRLIIAGVHFKSQRDRRGDPNSYKKRQAEIKNGVLALEEVKAEHPGTPIIVMGDFNTSRGDNEVAPAFERLGLFDAHLSESHFKDMGGLGRITHTYHPFVDRVEQKAVKGVLDRALLSEGLKKWLKKSAIYRYREIGSADKKSLPNSLAERVENPSDHYPIYFDLDPAVLFD